MVYKLTDNSSIILENLMKMIEHIKDDKFVINNRSNNEYNSFIKKIYNILKFYAKNKNELIIDIKKNKYTSEINKLILNKYYDNLVLENLKGAYIFNELKEYVKLNRNIELLQYNIKYKEYTIILDFINYKNNNNRLSDISIDKYVDIIMMALDLIINLTKNNLNCAKNKLNIYIFLTPLKKQLDSSYEKSIVGEKNVNTGYCYGCQDNSKIIIYRQEDFIKTIIHELLHTFGVDKFIIDNLNIGKENKLINMIFNIEENKNLGYGINESYIEFWACFINLSIYSYISTKNYMNYTNILNIYLNLEIIHNFVQIYKILNYYNIEYKDLINFTIKNNYKEDTHIISYYILKSFLLFDVKNFIKISNFYNKSIVFPNNNNNNLLDYIEYLKYLANNENIVNNFVVIQNYFVQNKNKNKNKNNDKDVIFNNNIKMILLEYHM